MEVTENTFKVIEPVVFENTSLVVGWDGGGAGSVSRMAIEYLVQCLDRGAFCRLEPLDFFPMGGVSVENDIARFPGAVFRRTSRADLVIFSGNKPRSERYEFINAVLDVAQQYCHARQIFTVGGIISSSPHTRQRGILSVYNSQDFKKQLRGYGLDNMDYEGPPALDSYILWLAAKRRIPAVTLWAEIPFYLATHQDYAAVRQILAFLDRRLELNLDLEPIDSLVISQEQAMSQLRQSDNEIDESITSMENGIDLDQAEQIRLVEKISQALRQGSGGAEM